MVVCLVFVILIIAGIVLIFVRKDGSSITFKLPGNIEISTSNVGIFLIAAGIILIITVKPDCNFILLNKDHLDKPNTFDSTQTFYQDGDHDGYGNARITKKANSVPIGYVSDSADCCDDDPNLWNRLTAKTYYPDQDSDGHGFGELTRMNTKKEGYSEVDDDAFPNDKSKWKATEPFAYYQDKDLDGYGLTSTKTIGTILLPGYSKIGGDLDDNNANITTQPSEFLVLVEAGISSPNLTAANKKRATWENTKGELHLDHAQISIIKLPNSSGYYIALGIQLDTATTYTIVQKVKDYDNTRRFQIVPLLYENNNPWHPNSEEDVTYFEFSGKTLTAKYK